MDGFTVGSCRLDEDYFWRIKSVDRYSYTSWQNRKYVTCIGTVEKVTAEQVQQKVQGSALLGTDASATREKHPGETSIEGDFCYVYDGIK